MLNADDIAGMRATVTSALPDTCVIRRDTAQNAYNSATLQHAAPTVATIYTGPCRVRFVPSARAPETHVGDQHAILLHFVGTIPYDATGVDADDYLIVTAATYSVDLVNQAFRIVDVELGSWSLGHRLLLQKREPSL